MALLPKAKPSFRPPQQSRGHPIATLIPLIANRDESAFNLFYEATNGLLFGLLLRMLGHSEMAEIVLAETYVEIRKRARHFSKQNDGPLTWLVLIAHRLAIEHLSWARQTSQIKPVSRDTSTAVPSPFINITEQRRSVRAAMDSLTAMQRSIIELSFFSGMTELEIAMKLGESPETVENGLNCAMFQLCALFKSMRFSSGARTSFGTLRQVASN